MKLTMLSHKMRSPSGTLAAIIAASVVMRLVLAFFSPWHGTEDLDNYFWPAEQALEGHNPYEVWRDGKSGDMRSDITPFELGIFTATTFAWRDPRAIQLLFVAADLGIMLLGLMLFSSKQARAGFVLFVGFGPLALFFHQLVPSDKSILLLLVIGLVMLLRMWMREESDSRRKRLAWAAVGVLGLAAAFKWVTIFALPAVAWELGRRRPKAAFGFVAFGVTVCGLLHLPWSPDWSFVYTYRFHRGDEVEGMSPAVLLDRYGLFFTGMLNYVFLAALLGTYFLFLRGRLSLITLVVLTSFLAVVTRQGSSHFAVAIMLLLLATNTWLIRRQLFLWVGSGLATVLFALGGPLVARETTLLAQWMPDRYATGSLLVWYVVLAVTVAWVLYDDLSLNVVRRTSSIGHQRE